MNDSIVKYYESRLLSAANELRKYNKLSDTYSFLRLFVLFAGGFAVYQSLGFESVLFTEALFILNILAFAWLVSRQAHFEKRKRFYSDLKQVTQNELDSMLKQENIYDDGSKWIDDNHIYTSDLDIFGKASLFKLVNRCATVPGNLKLAEWLKKRSTSDEIRGRQEAIKELALKQEFNLELKALLFFAKGTSEENIKNLFVYLQTPVASFHRWLKLYVSYQPLVFFPLLVLAYFIPPFAVPAGILAVLNMSLVQLHALKVNKADIFLGKAGKTLYDYSEAFRLIEQEELKSALLVNLKEQLKDQEGMSFHLKIKQLSALLNKLEYRLNIFVGPVLNFTMAWDLRQLISIEAWKQENSSRIGKAFDTLASAEALMSLTSLHTNYPQWCFPDILDKPAYTFKAVALGHPLIDERERVENDFSFEDAHQVDIVTGSNMAGKSTFLRTVGINAVLALSGAPACAAELKLSNMHVFTYMRIKDSLNEHTSTFKAELNRLKLLLETLKSEEKVYFLIDEMLRGTNSVDKYRGSKAVIEKLISEGGVGIVATHDLQIARLEDKYPDYVRNFYFDIQVRGDEMHFDYKLKEGECKTFNAAALLRQLGIEVE